MFSNYSCVCVRVYLCVTPPPLYFLSNPGLRCVAATCREFDQDRNWDDELEEIESNLTLMCLVGIKVLGISGATTMSFLCCG